MTKFSLVYRGSYRSNPFAIHAAGCKDIERTERRLNDGHVQDHEGTLESAVKAILDPEMVEMGYGEESIDILPCALKAVR